MTAWFVPGRIEVFGTHTDYAGGNTLVAAVDRGLTVTLRAGGDRFVAVSEQGARVELDPAVDDGLAPGHWGRYVHTVLRRLTADFGDLRPAEISVTSDLPLAAGMSSSSALLIGTALALIDDNGLRERPAWAEAITSDLDLATYLACVENGSGYKHLAGGTGVGTFGGSEDHCAILLGTDGHLAHFRFDPLELVDTVPVPDGWQLVVATSGVLAEKTGAALADYNRCSAEAREIVALAKQVGVEARSLAGVLRALGADDARRLVADSAALTRRLEHFLVESEHVVPEAVAALREGGAERFGKVSELSQSAAEKLLRNQVPETSQLVKSARTLGAAAASSFGAGFGGSVWALVDADEAERFAEAWVADYRAHFPEAGATAIAMAVRPSGAARRVPPAA
ncbi:galactokinase family protein [Tessaracoccus oleiagri]|uniref:Galactokinase n=1 Tax=Tessaracoccus oleiagri TaxID=686624 RepID=A0A1G9I0X4_9ACTN|nr:galactokinase family protein [Tessaracoccus oleiagri]SDL18732.1 galactokinase [Tessaracoccus oleiagri]